MGERKKKIILLSLITFSIIILAVVGSTFAYFTATISSEEGAVGSTAATFSIDLIDDTSLIKGSLIPSAEKYVDIASTRKRDGDFARPFKDPETGLTVIDKTTCIDDNLSEICSVYTFTVVNEMTKNDAPIFVHLRPSTNTFENLYIKVLDSDKNILENSKIHLIDNRYETEIVDGVTRYKKDADGNWIEKPNFNSLSIEPVYLESIKDTIPKATKNEETGEIIPSTATYSIVMWIMETGKDQTKEDGKKVFAASLTVNVGSADGGGITGVFSAGGVEEE